MSFELQVWFSSRNWSDFCQEFISELTHQLREALVYSRQLGALIGDNKVRHPVREPVHLQEEAFGGRSRHQVPGVNHQSVDHQWSPMDLGKKWGCSADKKWVKKAGKVLPKTYKKTEYNSESRTSTPWCTRNHEDRKQCESAHHPAATQLIGETYKKTERGRD